MTQNGWEKWPSLPVTIKFHCMVHFNKTAVMAIGGIQGNELFTNNKTFIFDLNHEDRGWSEGPELRISRFGHSCGNIRETKNSDKFSIIVIGGQRYEVEDRGWALKDLDSVEVLDEGFNFWRAGPQLPFGIHSSQAVELSDGSVILVAGKIHEWVNPQENMNTIFKLSHAEANWIELPQKIKRSRYSHVAFLVPDQITNCQKN